MKRTEITLDRKSLEAVLSKALGVEDASFRFFDRNGDDVRDVSSCSVTAEEDDE